MTSATSPQRFRTANKTFLGAVWLLKSRDFRRTSAGVGAITQQAIEAVIVEDRDAQALGLGQLRPRALPDHDVTRLLGNTARDLAPARFDLGCRFIARTRFKRAREDECQARERLLFGRRGRCRAFEVETRRTEPIDERAIAIDGEEPLDALRDCRTDAFHSDELLLRRIRDAIE